MKRVSLVLTLAVAAGLSAQAASAQTLKTVKDRGMLSCGVSQGLPGFSSPDDKSQFGDNRPSATIKPIRVAKKIPITETSSVLSRPTRNTRV